MSNCYRSKINSGNEKQCLINYSCLYIHHLFFQYCGSAARRGLQDTPVSPYNDLTAGIQSKFIFDSINPCAVSRCASFLAEFGCRVLIGKPTGWYVYDEKNAVFLENVQEGR